MKISPKQRCVLTWWCRTSPYRHYEAIICDGAVRSGKTLCISLGFIAWATAAFHGEQFALCGKSVISLRRNVLAAVLPKLRSYGFHWKEYHTENKIEISCGGHQNCFYLFGGYDEKSASLIQGVTLAGVLLDEVALMPRSFVEQACARCSVEGARLWFSCNPEGRQHWFYREWILGAKQRNALYLHFTMDDNPSLSEAVKRRYRNLYSGIFYRRFILGQWVKTRGVIYDFYNREHDATPVPEGPFDAFVVSADYGTTNPASFGLWARKGEVWYRIDEYYYDSRREGHQKTDGEYVKDLRTLLDGRTVEAVVVDPSAASFIEALRRDGLPVRKADNDVLTGIRTAAGYLKEKRLVICDRCEDCLREIELYCWDERDGREAPKKENDHAMDDLRYFAMYLSAQESESACIAMSVARGR